MIHECWCIQGQIPHDLTLLWEIKVNTQVLQRAAIDESGTAYKIIGWWCTIVVSDLWVSYLETESGANHVAHDL